MPGLRLDIDGATVLFHDDVVAHRKAKASPFARRLGRKERVEHLFLHFGGNCRRRCRGSDFYRPRPLVAALTSSTDASR